MKNLSKTKPNYTESHATEDGWVDSKTGELLVAIKNLKTKLGEPEVKRKRGRPKKISTDLNNRLNNMFQNERD